MTPIISEIKDPQGNIRLRSDDNYIAQLMLHGLNTKEELLAEWHKIMKGEGTVLSEDELKGIRIEMEWGS
jgi:hypothetical protein